LNSYKNVRENKNPKIPKGYRLKVSTHDKIKQLQNMTKGSQEMVISRAIRLYMKQLKQQITLRSF